MLLALFLLLQAAPATAQVIVTGNIEQRDASALTVEHLTNGALTGGTNWSATGDFALGGNTVTYTHSTAVGTFLQSSANGALSWSVSGSEQWFVFTYTTSRTEGNPQCQVTAAFAAAAVPLAVGSSAPFTQSVVFQAKSGAVGNFTLGCVSTATTSTITFDDLSLKMINGGTLTTRGNIRTFGLLSSTRSRNIASATALPAPVTNLAHVTGTTTITSIDTTGIPSGTCVTLIFDGILTLTDGSNLKMAGDFVTSADDVWRGCFDGTSWFEAARAVN